MSVSPLITTLLSLLFLAVGGAALVIMMANFGGKPLSSPERSKRVHRVLGWTFVCIFLVLLFVMVGRIERYWEESPARIAIHVVLSVSLLLLLAIKVTIPRLFPALAKHLFTFGVTVYLIGFVLVVITAGYYLLQSYRGVPYISHINLSGKMTNPKIGMELFIMRCSICHQLKDIMARRPAKEWETVVTRMVKLAEPRITPDEAEQILGYLQATHVPRSLTAATEAGGVRSYCTPCHAFEDIERHHYERSTWLKIVRRMSKRAPEIVPPGRIDAIADTLARENY